MEIFLYRYCKINKLEVMIVKKSDDDIKINKRSTDKVYFESTLVQNISDTLDFIKGEGKELIGQLDLEEFENIAVDIPGQISDVVDELSQVKSEIIKSDDLPENIQESSRNIKAALNRDEDYIRRAKRKMDKLDSDEFVNVHRANLRVVELCDKAIDVNDSNYNAYYLKGLALINLERYALAIDEFIKALALRDDTDAWLKIAEANMLNGDIEDAITVYDTVLKNNEDSFDALNGKAYCYYELKDYKNADESFKKANEIKILDDESKKIWDECLDNL